MKLKVLGFIFCFLVAVSAFAQDGAQIEMFNPQGLVKDVRQVSVRFSDQMVPFGDPRSLADPFKISCSEKSSSRWADGRNWIIDFDRDLPAGISCEFLLKDEVKTLTGKEIGGQKKFIFNTGGPSIRRGSNPVEGNEYIDEEQIFILLLDCKPDLGSIREHVFFSVDGIENNIGVRIIEGKQRQDILTSQGRYAFWIKEKQEKSIVLIQALQRFPSDTNISLIWGKDVKSISGVTNKQDQILNFRTRRPFSAEFNCAREKRTEGCIPFSDMSVNFTAPVSKAQAAKIALKSEDKKLVKKSEGQEAAASGLLISKKDGKIIYHIWKSHLETDDDNGGDVTSISFKGPFPESRNFIVELPQGMKDNAGRPLVNADKFPLSVRTNEYPPLAKFSARFGILELKANSGLPVTLRNVEQLITTKSKRIDQGQEVSGQVTGKIMNAQIDRADKLQGWLRKVAWAKREKSVFSNEKNTKKFTLPKPHEGKAFEVIGIPMKKAGLYIVELESAVLGKKLLPSSEPMYVPTAVLVTNLSAHFKWGRESSLVWVTTLDEGKPVRDAAVIIRDCQEKIIWQGRTDASGVARVNKQLPLESELPACNRSDEDYDRYGEGGPLYGLQNGLFVTAQAKDDLTFVHSSWDNGIEPWRFQLPYDRYSDNHYSVHTIFDRTLLRAGEKISMKHVFRKRSMSGFSIPAKEDMPDYVLITHLGSLEKYELPLHWYANGTAETTWAIPQDAKLGTYGVSLFKKVNDDAVKSEVKKKVKTKKRKRSADSFQSGEFRVEEFRVPLMKGTIQPPKEPLVNAEKADIKLGVQYLAGGGAGLIPVKLRSLIRPRSINGFAAFEDFVFGNGQVEEGLKRKGTNIADEDNESNGEEESGENPANKKTGFSLPAVDLNLDKLGAATTTLSGLPKVKTAKEIIAEMEFMDPNGETQTVSANIALWPSKYIVGIKPDSWAASKDNLKFQAAVVDLYGKPVAGAQVNVDIFEKKNYSHRKRLVGGFYAYEHTEQTKKIVQFCTGTTNSRGLLICEGKSPISGNLILQAQSADQDGNKTYANRDIWVADKSDWWFDVSDNDRIDLLPEKKFYSPGEKAVFQVRMPFRSATVLISVEREGVIDSWVSSISGKNPIIEVPVKPSYAPNVYISALVVRGRVPGIKPSYTIDMGKPAYKLGIAGINVGWAAHELKVDVTATQQVYKIRQKAQIKIKVVTASGKIPPAGSEVAIAAVDEGLLELMPNTSWNILAAMMGQRNYEVSTSSAQMQVIGKRHFGLKALPPGGGGGAGKQGTRELFDTLLLWKGKVTLDAQGEAVADIPLNDSITSFRIVAIATGGEGMFGTGSTSIRTTQDLMIFAGVSPLVREGDKYQAEFTLRNTTDHIIEAEVTARASGLVNTLEPLSVTLNPSEAKIVGWDVTAPAGSGKIQWEVQIKEKNTDQSDRIKVTQKIIPVTPVRTYQATIMQLAKDINIDVERPHDAIPGRGGINVILKPKISDGLSGVTDYMKQYPYTCFEQKVSVAVALRDQELWKTAMAQLPSHLDSSGFVKYFPICLYGSPTLTSYVLAIAEEADWKIPASEKEKMINALKGFISGKYHGYSPLPTADLNIRKLAATEALSRYNAADASMLNSVTIEPNLWPTSAVIDWLNILNTVKNITDSDKRMREAEQIIRSRLNFQGTKMGFATERTDFLWWLMVSNDVNAVRLILAMKDSEKWKEDMPRIVQGALARQIKGAWDLTLANAWGVLALEKFSTKFEAVPVSGISNAKLGTASKKTDWTASPKGTSNLYPWPAKREKLEVSHSGAGKPWLTIQSLAAIPLKTDLSSGYKIKRTVIPVERKNPKIWSAGDIIRVHLELEAQTDQTWVVVSDPVPAGATILGKNLVRESQILTKDEKRKGWVWPAFEERSFEAFRAYYEYVPKGSWTVEYTIRLNQTGTFQLPTTRVEAMYFPEMFGEVPNKILEVQP
jgi:uncharacterized protein YfaS (alpha-2-macroglobulin family)